MSSETINSCPVCGTRFDAELSTYCSSSCDEGQEAVSTLGNILLEVKPDPIKHIYFYDFAFGDLCDLFTTYLIRRTKTSNLQQQRIVDRALERVERAVITKLTKWSPVRPIRTHIGSALKELYSANARIWHWKDGHARQGITEGISAKAWVEYMSAYHLRDQKRRELDRLVEGTTMTDKTYDRAEGPTEA